jgi:RHS repeat-associated protein
MTITAVFATTTCFSTYRFTGKERDSESGNDYFGARYYSSSMGRWLSPDWSAKVMPVPYAKLDNPQSLNLYAYVGNNPLTRFDPDGHTVPDSCAKDSKCSITVKVNVILDKNAKLTKADWKAFQKDFLGKAQKDFGNSNIKLDYTFTNGSMSDDGAVKGAKSGYLNFVATDKEPGGTDGGSQTTKNGTALSFIDIKGLGSGGGPRSSNILVDSNVFEHELGQQFLGTQGTRTWGADVVRQFTIDPINTEQGWGMSSQSYRTGLEPGGWRTLE